MKSFSKRYPKNSVAIQKLAKIAGITSYDGKSNEFLQEKFRNRIAHVVKYICSQPDYIEPFLRVDATATSEGYCIHEESLRNLSEAELGYDITEYFNTKKLKLQYTGSFDEAPEYHDFALLDLIELILVFCNKDKREDIRKRFSELFVDESYPAIVMDWMIVPITDSGIPGIASLLKDDNVKEKLRTVYPYKYGNRSALTPEAAARASADMLQYVFSSEHKSGGTKKYSEDLLDRVAANWTTPSKKEELRGLLNDLVKLAKNFNNQISNVRHTDKHTISTSQPGIYDLIFNLNLSITELVLISAQNDLCNRRCRMGTNAQEEAR